MYTSMYVPVIFVAAFFTDTVVWLKLVVGNIHEKNFCGKNFLS